MLFLGSTAFIATGPLMLAHLVSTGVDGRLEHIGIWSKLYIAAAIVWAVVIWLY